MPAINSPAGGVNKHTEARLDGAPVTAEPGIAGRLWQAYSLRRNLKSMFVRPGANYAVIDGLRAFSILWTVIFHVFTVFVLAHPDYPNYYAFFEAFPAWAWVWNAEKGIDIFFVLSGFLIAGILLKEISRDGSINKTHFYVRRFIRLTPVYYLSLLAYMAAGGANVENIWVNFFYLTNFVDYQDQAMTWSWSLAVEEQFYLVFPVLLAFLTARSKSPLLWLWVLFLSSFLVRYVLIMLDPQLRSTPVSTVMYNPEYHAHRNSVIYDNFYSRYGSLLIGCIAAYYYHRRADQLKEFFTSHGGRFFSWFCLLIVLSFTFFPIFSKQHDDSQSMQILYEVVHHNIFSFGVSVLILASMHGGMLARAVRAVCANPVWYPIAQLSYSVYLFHLMVISVAVPTTINVARVHFPELSVMQTAMASFAVSLLLCMLIASLTYLLLEKPMMNMRR